MLNLNNLTQKRERERERNDCKNPLILIEKRWSKSQGKGVVSRMTGRQSALWTSNKEGLDHSIK